MCSRAAGGRGREAESEAAVGRPYLYQSIHAGGKFARSGRRTDATKLANDVDAPPHTCTYAQPQWRAPYGSSPLLHCCHLCLFVNGPTSSARVSVELLTAAIHS